ncbi:MAG: hypothetical protein EPN89_09060 [Methylovulum sp.]|nr:MAG: hypothetical protein EPN89_09060 [Methylovulum sp.]
MKLFLMVIAWFGGRSFREMNGRPVQEYDTSIAVGIFSLVSTGMILGGQYLLWSHLPHTEAHAIWITLFLTTLYTFFYRNVVRCLETMGLYAKGFTIAAVLGLVVTNALLAGHEWVILAFKPQVEAQAATNGVHAVTSYRSDLEASLRLPQLREDRKSIGDGIVSLQAERERVPESVSALQDEAKRCEETAKKLGWKLSNQYDPYQRNLLKNKLVAQNARCRATHNEAGRLLHEHQADMDSQIAELDKKRGEVEGRLHKADSQQQATFEQASPALDASATSGFARHIALWAAVGNGLVPTWAAFGLMLGVLALEGMFFAAKLLLKVDAIAWERRHDIWQTHMDGKLRQMIRQAYFSQMHSIVDGLKPALSDDLENYVRNIVVPSLRIEMEASAFAKAHASVERTQNNNKQAVPDLIRDLYDLKTKRATVSPLRSTSNKA